MAFTSNIRAFRDLSQQEDLVDLYRMLVALELALKDANCVTTGPANHDVPSMLAIAAHLPSAAALPFVSAQLIGYAAALKNDLTSVTCQGKDGNPCPVPAKSYPFIRYARRVGDWGGVAETPAQALSALRATCHNIIQLFLTHGAALGVHL